MKRVALLLLLLFLLPFAKADSNRSWEHEFENGYITTQPLLIEETVFVRTSGFWMGEDRPQISAFEISSGEINTNINTASATITSNVSGSTDNFALTANHLPAHKHKMFGTNNSRPSSLRITSHSNSNVAHEGSGGNAGYIIQRDQNNATPNAGNTGNAYSGNANGANHAHGAGNLAVTSTLGGTINATSDNVSSLLYTSLILNAIIKH